MIFKIFKIIILSSASVLVGMIAGYLMAEMDCKAQIDQTVAFQWGDGKYGPKFYGAHVFIAPNKDGYSVMARVYIGRGNDYYHDCGKLGDVETDIEAAEKWGTISWKPEGLYIGSGRSQYFLPRKELEAHR